MLAVRVSLLALVFFGALADARRSLRDQSSSKAPTNNAANRKDGKRTGKLFSLFNIVTFENLACSTQTTLAGSTLRNGTCLTSTECSDQGGTISGNCAAGFGACCLFTLSGTSGTITQNCTYIQNPGTPGTLDATDSITITVQKCKEGICDLRLDFETFNIAGTGNSLETGGGTCMDTFAITTTTGQVIPTICGDNAGQHIYVDLGTPGSNTATLSFNFAALANQQFDIKVSQIECNAVDIMPPDGCLQYHVGLTGRIETFNFVPGSTSETHLMNQQYNVCIRQEEGFDCIQYNVCADIMTNDGFSLLTKDVAGIATTMAQFDTNCQEDYVVLGASSNQCSCGAPITTTRSRYCGVFLNVFQAAANIPICDCTAPFTVGIVTDATTDVDGVGVTANTNPTFMSIGACLEYRQVVCP